MGSTHSSLPHNKHGVQHRYRHERHDRGPEERLYLRHERSKRPRSGALPRLRHAINLAKGAILRADLQRWRYYRYPVASVRTDAQGPPRKSPTRSLLMARSSVPAPGSNIKPDHESIRSSPGVTRELSHAPIEQYMWLPK